MSATAHWASLGETTSVAGIRLLWWAHACLGRRLFRGLLWPVVLWTWLRQPRARHASLDYLRRIEAAHGAIGGTPGRLTVLRHFASFGEALLDKLLAASGRYPFERVQCDGALPGGGMGGVIVTAHVGCLELCQALAERDGAVALKVLVHTRHAPRFNAVLKRLQPHSRIELLQVTEVDALMAARLAPFVEGGGWVAIVGDRVPVQGGKTVTLPFLGAPAPFPAGACVLAGLWRCPLVLMLCHRQADGGHRLLVRTLSPAVQLPRAQRQAVIEGLMRRYVELLESVLVVAPLEWFNFFDFWGQPTTAPHSSSQEQHGAA